MSDFFQGLLDRGRRPMEVVRPRLPAIFEPTGLSAGTQRWESSPAMEGMGETPASRSGMQRQVEVPGVPEVEVQRDGFDPPANRRSAVHRRIPVRGMDGAIDIESVVARGSEEVEAEPIGRATIQESGERGVADAPQRQVDGVSRLEAREPVRSSWRDEVRGAEVESRAADLREIPKQMRREREAEQETGPRQSIVPIRATEKIAAQRVKDRIDEERFARGRTAVAAEPTIHVSIGRIEIRAVPESAGGKRQKAASPVMGLDEYLRERAKGAGR